MNSELMRSLKNAFCLADIFRSHSTPSHFHSITQGKECNVHMYLFPGAAVEPCLVDWGHSTHPTHPHIGPPPTDTRRSAVPRWLLGRLASQCLEKRKAAERTRHTCDGGRGVLRRGRGRGPKPTPCTLTTPRSCPKQGGARGLRRSGGRGGVRRTHRLINWI